MGSVVITIDGEDATDRHTRCRSRHEHHGLLSVDIRIVGGGFAHYNVDLAAGITGAGRPPFLSDKVLVGIRREGGYARGLVKRTEPLRT